MKTVCFVVVYICNFVKNQRDALTRQKSQEDAEIGFLVPKGGRWDKFRESAATNETLEYKAEGSQASKTSKTGASGIHRRKQSVSETPPDKAAAGEQAQYDHRLRKLSQDEAAAGGIKLKRQSSGNQIFLPHVCIKSSTPNIFCDTNCFYF